eukprot:TRINITY_DN87559_c0_g1_i1.p1 TRINITY_DN87559_c0_g1~~TRINITY_DN87559_c0_g1_i1.p1  ORF type:complete len:244 (-),score=41.48 TRINITY_DN87559_c0_g1_i1:171-902(-)
MAHGKHDEMRVQEIFKKFDADGSGSIERKEMEKALRALDWEVFSKENCRKIFHSMDKDGDGHVDWQEFVTWVFGDEKLARLILENGLHGQGQATASKVQLFSIGQPPDGEWSYQWGFLKYAKAHFRFFADGRISGYSETTPARELSHGGKIVDGGWSGNGSPTKIWWRTENEAGKVFLHEADITLQPRNQANIEGVWKPDPLPLGPAGAAATQRLWGRSDALCHEVDHYDPSAKKKHHRNRMR